MDKLDDDILVFCAGSKQVEDLVEKLQNTLDEQTCEILPMYSSLPFEESQQGFEIKTHLNTYRRIIVATNVAESSVTIDGIAYVVDLMLEKVIRSDINDSSNRPQTNDNNSNNNQSMDGLTTLVIKHISQSSSIQREGRIGRTKPGTYYAMCSANFYKNLPSASANAFENGPILTTILKFIDAGLDPQPILNIRTALYQIAVNELFKLKLLQQDKEDQVVVTELGRFCPNFTTTLRNACWIHETWKSTHDFGCGSMHVVLILVALFDALSTQGLYIVPRRDPQHKETNAEYQKRVLSHKSKYFSRFSKSCDFGTMLNIFCLMFVENGTASSTTSQSKEEGTTDKDYIENIRTINKRIRNWNRENSLNNRILYQARLNLFRLVEQTRMHLKHYDVEASNFTDSKLYKKLLTEQTTLLSDAKMTYMLCNPDKRFVNISLGSCKGAVKFEQRALNDPPRHGYAIQFYLNNYTQLTCRDIVDYRRVQAVYAYSQSRVENMNTGAVSHMINYAFEITLNEQKSETKENELA